MAHWLYILGGLGSGSLGYGLWYYGWRAFFLIRGCKADDEHRRWWFEAARLMRKDAKDLPSYLPDNASDVRSAVRRTPPSRKRARSGDADHPPGLDRIAS
jgi:hypothetical protein